MSGLEHHHIARFGSQEDADGLWISEEWRSHYSFGYELLLPSPEFFFLLFCRDSDIVSSLTGSLQYGDILRSRLTSTL